LLILIKKKKLIQRGARLSLEEQALVGMGHQHDGLGRAGPGWVASKCCWTWLRNIRIHLMFLGLADVHKLCTSVFKLRNIFSVMNIGPEEHKKAEE
jgi:hypothetical protein